MIEVKQEDFAKALDFVGRSVSSRSTLPILGTIKLVTDATNSKSKRLVLQATNLEIATSVEIPYWGDGEFSIAVNAKMLTDTTGAVSKEVMRLDVDRTMTLHIEAEGLKLALKGMPGDEFPIMPSDEGALKLRLPLPDIIGLFNSAAYAASTDESRPTLTGCEVVFTAESEKRLGGISQAGTDGYRLAYRNISLGGITENAKAIIPARNLSEFVRIAGKCEVKSESDVILALVQNRNQIILRIPYVDGKLTNVTLSSQLIDARFPDYRAIIPVTYKTRVTVTTAALHNALKTALLFAKSNANTVNLSVAEGKPAIPGFGNLTISATDAELGQSEETLLVSLDGVPLDIVFSCKYLMDALSHIGGTQVVLEFGEHTRPVKILGSTTVDGEELHVIMPMNRPR